MRVETIIVFKDGILSQTFIPNKPLNKAAAIAQADLFGFPIAYFINIKYK